MSQLACIYICIIAAATYQQRNPCQKCKESFHFSTSWCYWMSKIWRPLDHLVVPLHSVFVVLHGQYRFYRMCIMTMKHGQHIANYTEQKSTRDVGRCCLYWHKVACSVYKNRRGVYPPDCRCKPSYAYELCAALLPTVQETYHFRSTAHPPSVSCYSVSFLCRLAAVLQQSPRSLRSKGRSVLTGFGPSH